MLQPRSHYSRILRTLLNLAAAGVQRAVVPPLEEYPGAVYGRSEPQQHVHEIHPDRMFHSQLAVLLGRRVGGDVDSAEETKDGGPQDAAVSR